jgi:hypothetical protein
MEIRPFSKGIYGRNGGRNIMYIRQGDILFERIDNADNSKVKLDTKTVALGEITGHSHSFAKSEQVLLSKRIDEDIPTQLQVLEEGGATLTHQEHLPIHIPKGVYRIRREQSYNPFLKNIQRSAD